ncbi:MAG: D-glucosaminate-6-phosphate ammonia lyase [Candidatus Moanabacter tarae]|uniref:D-glucosaminate-6-phosphate ammonia lyase n=1 Tax=Candidatus Moanibacter tarae TaxID=2200854 RepID=A0A2Z4AAZ9_9BACT|nr:MAG: D-glucosaminate-6-phosphate ammonia lyase [Candidatus Moanabacter tarae]|tara:strand:- start:691 stop:1887 length:1197 start_codon:yes stop_codon:yes gene_type:complete
MSIYRDFGLEPIINASGGVTRLGGAPMPEKVLEAFHSAAEDWVPLEQLQGFASLRIAEATGTDSGLVVTGAAGALTMGTAAILAGHDIARMDALPHSRGFPNQFLISRDQRSGYDHAVRAAGAELVDVGYNEIISGAGVRRTEPVDYAVGVTSETAGILYVVSPHSHPPLETVVEIGKKHHLPVLVDAAGELPPRENLTAIPGSGADLVAFSGGKSIRGPQSTGLLCGRRDLISSAALQMLDMDEHLELWDPPDELIDRGNIQGLPRHGIGRSLKVSKEEIVAFLTALDLFVGGAYDHVDRFEDLLKTVSVGLSSTLATMRINRGRHSESIPLLEVTIDELALSKSATEVCWRLRKGSPPIYVGHGYLAQGKLIINPLCIKERDVEFLISRLMEELTV